MKRYFDSDPILIGGVGGSGTRIVTELLKQSGIFMGSRLNESNDNLQIAKEFPNMRDVIHNKGHGYKRITRNLKNQIRWNSNDERQIIHKTLIRFEGQMFNDYLKINEKYNGWGWKIPGNFFILEHLSNHYQNLKYIHTIRNGFDMAFSKNQDQLKNWGAYYGVEINNYPLPKAALNYWYAANKKAISKAEELLKDNFLLVKFEELCFNPGKTITRILNFIKLEKSDKINLEKLVNIPDTIDRYKNNDLTIFDENDFNKVREFGYEF